MGQTVKLDTGVSAYLAKPDGTPRGGIVVIQEIFGVNGHIRDIADRFAKDGYVAIAPAFFDHVEEGVELGYDEPGMKAGLDYVGKVGMDKPVADVEASAKYIADAGKVGTIGFCWGGTVALLSATRLGLPSVSYYGGRNDQFLGETPKAPVMFHFGGQDSHITPDIVQRHREAYPDMEVFVYPQADHGFNCDRRASYNETAAKQAWTRTTAFFAAQLEE
ncbi:dienelactone hydrolase family protein [Oleiagrimonas sp. C23AA]|uniref:dienelactone hydrolase family protein n=1 Tax=Oleiagrimonas sp. C23AA TaxID=2719047 RepID=UPI00141F7244|nr:dienelactone hydrolase family protein [Oleiagrimonas sp. C23AA]NII10111.1 dienelactone hydrolase family protein [Oleiagrimonas sp. C23AA]